jgi:hypothetical protein
LQETEQNRTAAQSRTHLRRQAKGRPHRAQVLVGRSDLRRIFGMGARWWRARRPASPVAAPRAEHYLARNRSRKGRPMKDAEPQAIRLADYTPPNWLIDDVHLTFRLAPRATRVISRIRFRPNP